MLAWDVIRPYFFPSRLDAYATLIPRFSDFAIMIDVEALEASPAYANLDDSVKRQLQLYPDMLADAGIEVGEGNRLRRILVAGKSQSGNALISFFFDAPVTFSDGALTRLTRKKFLDYDIWVRREPDTPIWYFADRTAGLLLVSDENTLVTSAIDRREKAAAFRLSKSDFADPAKLLDGDEPIWGVFTELRAFRGEEDRGGRTFAGLVAVPPRRVPIAGGAAWITLGNELIVQETLVFKTEAQASEYVQQRSDLADELPDGEATASWTIGDRMLAVQKIEQNGKTVTVEQSLPLDFLKALLNGWPASESMYRLYLQ
jgi:hypothetical protein